ncbi:helix-turn-helix domain-containing protein [Roseomonas terrae]|uniref:Helix-turn-helix domain-containing protein n=1 Tax=Neoroseomonas terrae TaxID=424799 RepID=A0ABS5EKR2_9PROT|nr:helix-turn-helix domain-containing protein [Neoroseomonas terrae]MBR0651615.1 helix-turn-helix domain-containing protein [Neoroseomonas terrae]
MERIAYSIAETTKLLGVGRATLYRWISAGTLRVRRVGGRTLVPAAEISRLVGGDGGDGEAKEG